ncbi:MAG: hypothetical protein A2787_04665 [Omnitrophica WOR_2 bacterium RIFCSPHIGHO2_01_FULL_48_9]|nr:MAG: hypothetical protein A3D10_05215 [Omnitrophica WOR_2 bacterium RIFCSPHIGHO2_02_FULL_48_11]OGX31544.1 MAG: hypothetical protein A2787_04665 [Omnitrophica WOR_2 bacterium RIFCSPHIGHO2_01_FULL_48_9]
MYQPQGSAKNSVTVVFDGKPGMWGAPASATVKVIFATEESADDKIKDIVRQAQNKKQIVVVTDDRDIKYAVRALGATVMSVADFLTKLKPRPEKSRLAPALREPPESTKGIPKTIEYQITAEMEKIWLTPKEKRKEQSR